MSKSIAWAIRATPLRCYGDVVEKYIYEGSE